MLTDNIENEGPWEISSPGPALVLDADDRTHNQFPPRKYFSVRIGPEYSTAEAARDFLRMTKIVGLRTIIRKRKFVLVGLLVRLPSL